MFEWLVAPFVDFGFMQRALAGCFALSLSAAPVGVFLMLRRMSLTGDAMAHAILPGAAVGFFFAGLSVGAMTIGGLVAGSLVALLSGFVSRLTATGEDSSMAAFYLLSLAIGVIIVSTSGSAVDLLHVLFGSALSLNNESLYLLGAIATITIPALLILYRPLVIDCFDPQFLSGYKHWGAFAHFAFLILVVLNLVAGFHALGTLMSVGIMILPGAAARFWAKTLESMLLLSIVNALAACALGLLLSFHIDWPTGPVIVLVLGMLYVVSVVIGPRGGLAYRVVKLKHLEA